MGDTFSVATNGSSCRGLTRDDMYLMGINRLLVVPLPGIGFNWSRVLRGTTRPQWVSTVAWSSRRPMFISTGQGSYAGRHMPGGFHRSNGRPAARCLHQLVKGLTRDDSAYLGFNDDVVVPPPVSCLTLQCWLTIAQWSGSSGNSLMLETFEIIVGQGVTYPRTRRRAPGNQP